MGFLQSVAGSVGNFIDALPGRNQTGTLFGGPIDFSRALQNYAASGRPQVLGAETIQNYPGATAYGTNKPIQGPIGNTGLGGVPAAGGVPAGYNAGAPAGGVGQGVPAGQTGGQPAGQPGDNGDYQRMLDQKYGELTGNIDRQLSELPGQRAGQEKIVQNAADQVGNTLTTTYGANKNTLESNQAKNLNELSDYLQQAWQQGNNMLGTRGASDSSASNMYSYSLAKQGSQQRGDIMQQTQQLQTNLKTAYDTEMQNNELEKQSKMFQIAQWFDEAQNQFKGMKAEYAAQKSEEALNYALQLVGQAQQVWASNKSVLDQWATSKATSLTQLAAMLNQNSQNMPTFQGMNSNINNAQANPNAFNPGYFNTNDEEQKKLV